jgi:branched-chain amino acid transport system substrate-binding protein
MRRRESLKMLAAATAVACVPALAREEPIVVGQSCALTGPAAQLGIQYRAGAMLFFDGLNAAGGVHGRRIELRSLDDGYEPARCLANTEQLIGENVLALFGYVGTPTSLAALPRVNEARIPFFAPLTGAEALRDPFSRYVFHVRAGYFRETAMIVGQLMNLNLRKVAVFYQDDAYGNAGLEGVSRALKTYGLVPAASGRVNRNSTDVAQAVKDIVPHLPDAIVQVSAYASCAAFVRAARKAGYGGTFYNLSFVGTQALAQALGRDGGGIIISQVVPYPFSAATSLSGEYQDALRKAGGAAEPNYSGMEGYLAAKVFAEGLTRAGPNVSRETLVAGLESMRDVNFGGFNVDFRPHSRVASNFVDLTMLAEDGRIRH